MVRRRPASHRAGLVVPVAFALIVVVAIALVGPGWYERLYHPLRYQPLITAQARVNSLDPYFVAAVINVESRFREDAVSEAGAVGLMQIKPSTASSIARHLGIPGKMTTAALSVPDTNIRVGTRYLAYLMQRYDRDERLALAAYNAGLTNADRWAADARRQGRTFSDSIAFPATARYVEDVIAQAGVYRRLYPGAFSSASK